CRKKLADQDSEGYEKTSDEMIKKELRGEKVAENELDLKTQQNLSKLRQGGLQPKEVDIIKDEVSNNIKLKSAEKKLAELIEDYKQNPSSERKAEILAFISSSNSF